MGFRGDTFVQVEDREYHLVLDFNAFSDFETRTGVGYQMCVAMNAHAAFSAVVARNLVRSCGYRYHPDMTLVEAGDILSADTDILAKLFALASPTEAEQAEAGN